MRIFDVHDEIAALAVELAETKQKLETALSERDTARAEATHYRTYYTRSGW